MRDRRGGIGRRLVTWLGAVALALLLAAPSRADDASTSPGRIEFVGRNALATANGTFHVWRVVDHAVDLAAIERSHASIEVDLASVDTGNERRDDHLRDPDFFEVERFPTAGVRVHGARAIEPDAEGRPRFAVRYDVDLHGVEKTLEGEVTLVGESPPVFEGALVIDRLDFGIGAPPSRWNPMSIDTAIPVRFRVELGAPTAKGRD